MACRIQPIYPRHLKEWQHSKKDQRVYEQYPQAQHKVQQITMLIFLQLMVNINELTLVSRITAELKLLCSWSCTCASVFNFRTCCCLELYKCSNWSMQSTGFMLSKLYLMYSCSFWSPLQVTCKFVLCSVQSDNRSILSSRCYMSRISSAHFGGWR